MINSRLLRGNNLERQNEPELRNFANNHSLSITNQLEELIGKINRSLPVVGCALIFQTRAALLTWWL
jgi:hypothetical protein